MSLKTSLGLSIIIASGMTAFFVIQAILAHPWLLLIPAVPVAGLAGWFLWNWAGMVHQKKKLLKAQVAQAEYQARTIDTSDGTWFIQRVLDDGSVDIASLHNNPQWQINGHRAPVTQAELFAWQAYNRRGANEKAIGQLQSGMAQLPSPQLDFITALSDPLQAYAIIGPQRIGKSLLIQQLTNHLIQRGQRCVVIGTKAGPDEWTGCTRYFGGPSDSIVPDALDRLYQESEQRIKENISIPLVAVVLDDWLNTAEIWSEIAERFFVEAATRMLTAGIVPYFILHSDSKSDWGIKHGAQLKNNFTHLFLSAPRSNGRIEYSQLKAFMVYPGDKEQHQVRLPYSTIQPDLVLQPTGEERQILSMLSEGLSYKDISESIWGTGKYGKFYNDKIDKIIQKYSPRIS